MFILKKGHQPGVYVPLRALFLVYTIVLSQPKSETLDMLMKANTNFHIKHGSPEDAAQNLEDLRR